MSANSQRLASIIAQKNSPYRFQGLPDAAAVDGVKEGRNAVYIGDKKEASGYPCKIFDENGNASNLFYVRESQAQYKAIQAKAQVALTKIIEERDPYAGKDHYSFKIVDGTLDAACTDKNTVYIERSPFGDKGHLCKIVDEEGNATISFYVSKMNFKSYEDISLYQVKHKAVIDIAKDDEKRRANHASLAEKLRADSDYLFEEVAFDALALSQHEKKNTVYISKDPNMGGYRCKIVNEQGHAVRLFSIDAESAEHKEIHAIIEITQEVTSFPEKLVQAKDIMQIKGLEEELLVKIDKIQKESVKGKLREEVIAIVKLEITKKIQHELLAEALKNKDYNLAVVSPDVVNSDEKEEHHMVYIAEKADDKGAFIGYRCKITDEIGMVACRFSINPKSEEHKEILAIVEAQRKAAAIAAPFREKLDKAKTKRSIEDAIYSFSAEIERTADEMIQQELSVINEEMGKIASKKLQDIDDIDKAKVILRGVYQLSKELAVQCDLKQSKYKAEEPGFLSTLFGSNETQFEELEAVIEICEKIEEIDEKLKNTENEEALKILKEASVIAQKSFNCTKIFFKGTEQVAAKEELEKLKAIYLSTSPGSHTPLQKRENSEKIKLKRVISDSDMLVEEKSDEEKSISSCNYLLSMLEKKESSKKDDVKAQLSAIEELLKRVEQFNFPSSILSGFINVIYPKLVTALKIRDLTVENMRQLYADIRLEYSGLLNAANELASSNVADAEKEAEEKKKQMFGKIEEVRIVEEKLKDIEKEEKSIGSIEDIKTKETMRIRIERKVLLSDIKEDTALVTSKELTQAIAGLESVVETNSDSDLFEEKVSNVINTLERNQNDITSRIADCDKEINEIEARIKVEAEQAKEGMEKFKTDLVLFNHELTGLNDKHPLKKVLAGAIGNLERSLKEIDDIKPEVRIMLLEMEKRNVSDAIENFLQNKQHVLIIPSSDKYAFAKDFHDLKEKKSEKDIFEKSLNSLSLIFSSIRKKVGEFFVFRREIRITSVLLTKQAEIKREKVDQEKIIQGKILLELTAQEKALQKELIDLNEKKQMAITERNRLEAIISAEHERLGVIVTKPFQLFIISNFDFTHSSVFNGIQGNAIILDDKSRVHFIIDGKIVLDKKSKPKEVAINNRHSIPRAADLQSSTGGYSVPREITDYRGICAVIEEAARNGDYRLQYDTEAEKSAEDKASAIREANEKRRESEKEREIAAKEREIAVKERADRAAQEEKQRVAQEEKQRAAQEAKDRAAKEAEEKVVQEAKDRVTEEKKKVETLRIKVENLAKHKQTASRAQESKINAVQKQSLSHFGGARTIEEAAQLTQNKSEEKRLASVARSQLSTQSELEQERIKLEAELKKLEDLYDTVLKYDKDDLYTADIDLRKEFRDTLCAEIGKSSALSKALNATLTELKDDSLLCTPRFVVLLDKIEDLLFSFVKHAKLEHLEIVEYIVTTILPLLEEKSDESLLSQFRAVDEANRKVEKALKQKPGEIAQVKTDLETIKEKLQKLESEAKAPVVSAPLSPAQKRPNTLYHDSNSSATGSPGFFRRAIESVTSQFTAENLAQNVGSQSISIPIPTKNG